MVLVKVLGAIDLAAAIAFMLLIFGFDAYTPFFLGMAGLLLVKGLFVFTGEFVLSFIDLGSSLLLLIALFITLPAFLAWVPAFLLTAKGIVSFL